MNCPHCQQPITRAQIASALANTAPKGKGARPGAAKLVRNPYGRKGKPVAAMLEQLRSPNNGFISPEEANKQ